ncbi:MAG: sterol carrier protein domain-containing protein, partial [Clostridia bacterium]
NRPISSLLSTCCSAHSHAPFRFLTRRVLLAPLSGHFYRRGAEAQRNIHGLSLGCPKTLRLCVFAPPCIAREEWRWKQLFSNDPYKTKERIFIRYNSDGRPVAYLKMQVNQVAAYTLDLVVIEAAWSGYEGILGLLATIGGYSGDLRKLEMDVPEDFPIELLVKENWALEISRRHTGMNRIINIEKALETISKPSEQGRAVIGVVDEYAPWNTGNWAVEWHDGDSRVARTGEEADIVCEAASISQLVTGYLPLDYMRVRSDISVKKNEEVLGKLFVKKPCFIWDRF